MASAPPAINVVEKNLYAPRPFVFTEVALCLRDAIRAAGFPSEHLQNRIDPHALSIVLGAFPHNAGELEHFNPSRCAVFNFEQLGSNSIIATPEYRRWLADWMVLDYHTRNVELLKRENGSRQCFTPQSRVTIVSAAERVLRFEDGYPWQPKRK